MIHPEWLNPIPTNEAYTAAACFIEVGFESFEHVGWWVQSCRSHFRVTVAHCPQVSSFTPAFPQIASHFGSRDHLLWSTTLLQCPMEERMVIDRMQPSDFYGSVAHWNEWSSTVQLKNLQFAEIISFTEDQHFRAHPFRRSTSCVSQLVPIVKILSTRDGVHQFNAGDRFGGDRSRLFYCSNGGVLSFPIVDTANEHIPHVVQLHVARSHSVLAETSFNKDPAKHVRFREDGSRRNVMCRPLSLRVVLFDHDAFGSDPISQRWANDAPDAGPIQVQ